MAQGDKKVILVDCDLRRPSIHKKFKVSNLAGLSDVIIGKSDLSKVMHRYNKNLVLLTSGKIPPNPSEMLSSKSMENLLEKLRENFDLCNFRYSTVQAITDSQILSTKADGTILVVRAERTKKESVNNAINLLKKVNANIIGTVLNGTDLSRNKYQYYYGEK